MLPFNVLITAVSFSLIVVVFPGKHQKQNENSFSQLTLCFSLGADYFTDFKLVVISDNKIVLFSILNRGIVITMMPS